MSGRVSVRPEVPDAAAEEEAMALAIAEESDAVDGRLAAHRKLTEKVNTAFSTRQKASARPAGDEGMALAIAEEHNGQDGAFVAGLKLVEYVNTARILKKN